MTRLAPIKLIPKHPALVESKNSHNSLLDLLKVFIKRSRSTPGVLPSSPFYFNILFFKRTSY
jgi:hypothetical protein